MIELFSRVRTRLQGTFNSYSLFYNNLFYKNTKLIMGARGLHAPHPDGGPKAGKTSGQHEVNEVNEVLPAFGRPSGWGACRPLPCTQGTQSWKMSAKFKNILRTYWVCGKAKNFHFGYCTRSWKYFFFSANVHQCYIAFSVEHVQVWFKSF